MLKDRLDLGFVEGHENTPGIHVQPFTSDQLVLIAASGHPLAGKLNVEAADLQGETFIWREVGSGIRDVMAKLLDDVGIHPGYALELHSCEGVTRVVAAGLGLSVVSRHAIELELIQGLLVVLEGPGLNAQRALSIVTHKDRRPSAASLAFLTNLWKGFY